MRGVGGTRWLAFALAASALVVSCATVQVSPETGVKAQEIVPAPPARLQPAEPAHPRYIGSGGCAARACHGSPTLTLGREWSSAFTVWSTRDPHAQAYAVLSTPESQQMAKTLGLKDATTADRCLVCHALPVAGAHAG